MPAPTATFTHEPLDQETRSVAGQYTFTEEVRLELAGRQVLVRIGFAVVDTACCGVGGCGYALVPGFVRRWRHTTDARGLPLSEVEPVRDPADEEAIRRAIMARHPVTQVRFL